MCIRDRAGEDPLAMCRAMGRGMRHLHLNDFSEQIVHLFVGVAYLLRQVFHADDEFPFDALQFQRVVVLIDVYKRQAM